MDWKVKWKVSERAAQIQYRLVSRYTDRVLEEVRCKEIIIKKANDKKKGRYS